MNDLIFTSDARLHAIVVNSYAGYRGGYRAFPFYGYPYGWAPSYPVYHLGYDRDDVVNLRVLDYDKIKGVPARSASKANEQGRTEGTTGSAAAQRNQSDDGKRDQSDGKSK